MTDRTKERISRWAPAATSVLAAGAAVAMFAMQATAAASVAPLKERTAAVEGRVSVLEAQRVEDKERLGRIEAKIDRVDSKIDQVLAR